MAGNILVFAERRDGQTKRPGLEAISTARRLAGVTGGRVVVVALGPGAAAEATQLAGYGADVVHVYEEGFLELYQAEAYAACLAASARDGEAAVVLAPATVMGKDVGARAAARLGAACASDLVEVDLESSGVLRGKRPVYSGKAYASISIPAGGVAVATLRPNVFPLAQPDNSRTATVESRTSPVTEDQLRVRTIKVEKAEQQELDVSEAGIVVAGGRGLKEAENFSLIRDLAQALGGAVGASRAVVDAGWIPHAHQVGQTGKVVSPTLYVACGISGAIQHLAGMSSSKVIVAINKDADAPIFKVADYGIVGDLFELVPALTEAVRKLDA
jgi:electron transfer flavoprotein alpha subunit